MFELKPMSKENVAAALKKAERYRLLGEPAEADSICRDILAIDPNNKEAVKMLLLAITDRFGVEDDEDVEEARALLPRLEAGYERYFYAGIICERKGKSLLAAAPVEAGPAVYKWLREAMRWYDEAEAHRTTQGDDAILRWNTCARMINRNRHVRPPPGPPSGEWRIRDLAQT